MISTYLLKIDSLVVLYLLLTSSIIFLFRHKQKKTWNLYLLGNAVLVALFVAPETVDAHRFRALQVLFDWTPLICLGIFHRQTGLLTHLFHQRTFDDSIVRFEQRVFKENPCFYISNRLNFVWVSEFLHFCYFSFYLMIYGVPLYFYVVGQYSQFYQCVFAELLLFFVSYLTHSFIPVSGPRTLFAKIEGPSSQGLFYKIVHKVLADHSTHGTAFPSSHVGTAFLLILLTWHFHTPLFYFLLPFASGLIISTVYGRFHYLTDALFGMGYACLVYWISMSLYH